MIRKSNKKPEWQKIIAKERIEILFSLAEKEFAYHPEHSHRYVELASRIGKRYNITFPKALRRKFCRECLHYLKPGVNSRVRTRSEEKCVTITCKDCGRVTRFPYK